MSYESNNKMVSHPDHYNSGGMEVIDVIDAFTADLEGTEAVCTANAIKYILRWKKKNGLEDIEKAIWYLTHLKEHLGCNAEEALPISSHDEPQTRMLIATGIDRDLKDCVLYAILPNGDRVQIHKDYKTEEYVTNDGDIVVFKHSLGGGI